MRTERQIYKDNHWIRHSGSINAEDVDLVTVFGDTDEFIHAKHYEYFKNSYPNAHILGCTSSGNIIDDAISDETMVATAVSFDSSKVVLKSVELDEIDNVQEASKNLAAEFDNEGLKHIFLITDGLFFNGSDIVKAFNEAIDVPKSGGLAGDGDRFQETWVMADATPRQKVIAALGFYGEALVISSSYCGGWSAFGAQRVITKSQGNVLYELDGEPALDLYRKYLGEYADGLPISGLRFPLSIKEQEDDSGVIRTLLGINEEEKSIMFAGDVNEGFYARLMKPNITSLINGAAEAAQLAKRDNVKEAFGLIVSCVGRRLVMNQLVDEELEAVGDVLGENVKLAGFYSYGEITPYTNDIHKCQLHNQTMTMTIIYED